MEAGKKKKMKGRTRVLSHKIISYQLHWPSRYVIPKKQDTFKLPALSRFRSQVSQFIQMGARSRAYCLAAPAETLSPEHRVPVVQHLQAVQDHHGSHAWDQVAVSAINRTGSFFRNELLFFNPCISKRGKRWCFCHYRDSFPGFDDAVLVPPL